MDRPRRADGIRERRVDTSLGGLLGMAEGYDLENVRPEDELAAVIEKKRAHLQGLDAAWATITGALQGGAGMGLVLDGNIGSIHRQLVETCRRSKATSWPPCAVGSAPRKA